MSTFINSTSTIATSTTTHQTPIIITPNVMHHHNNHHQYLLNNYMNSFFYNSPTASSNTGMTHSSPNATWQQLINSLGLSILISVLYPASLYFWPQALTSDRHHPRTIRRNFISIAGTSIVSFILMVLFLQHYGINSINSSHLSHQPQVHYKTPFSHALRYFNFRSYRSLGQWQYRCILLPLIQVAILFTGPLYLDLKSLHSVYRWGFSATLRQSLRFFTQLASYFARQFADLGVVRNLVVAPLSEELIFRGILLPVLLPFWSRTMAITISSVLFGAMHSHHFLRSLWCGEQLDRRELLGTLFQSAYTALFGVYACLTYLATGQLITPIVVHSFCNMNGLPNFGLLSANRFHLALTIAGVLVWLVTLGPLVAAAGAPFR